MVMANDTVWIENNLPKEMGGAIQVTKMKASGKVKKSNALLAFLFDDQNILKKFKVLKFEERKKEKTYTLEPILREEFGDLIKLEIAIDEEEKEILKIKHWDELDNTTEFQFSKIKKDIKIDKKKFEYKPPKSAEVTVMESDKNAK